ncbi:hypothetical protein [Bradyrhizobium sp. AUGA SZCCT0431]|uniref:hypothetical protein n=1 Tax=Bradyrhizobium sp. AUGA SZCCT0431 TaxID=2807674 RepID=UPI001BACBD21|nr:hypothetical protein [Bradyrhizobium sp. AUGA SZCCT0431]
MAPKYHPRPSGSDRKTLKKGLAPTPGMIDDPIAIHERPRIFDLELNALESGVSETE